MSSLLPWTGLPGKCLLLFLLVFSPVFAHAGRDIPGTYVLDSAGIIGDKAELSLSGRLQELEHKTGAQMIILTVDSTEGIPIEGYALKQAESWKLGRKDRDDGILFVIAWKDRKYRIEVGYGLEGVLPDSLLGSIAREHLVPLFRQGMFSEGITAAVTVITDTIARSHGTVLRQPPAPEPAPVKRNRGVPLKEGLAIFFFLLMLGMGFPRLYPPANRRSVGSRRYSARGFPAYGTGGFGSFRRGFGSFGGGRGGSFGGGGVSGGW